MSDRELLQWAATAAGLTYRDDLWGGGHVQRPDALWELWNPLTDDSDALRLAVRLKLSVWFEERETSKWTHIIWVSPVFEPYINDVNAATRRAIVRAAAEIGRAM